MENQQLAVETILEANEYMGKVISGIDFIVDKFLSGREDLALTSFVNLVDGINWLTEVVNLTSSLRQEVGIDFPNIDAVENIAKEMIEAFENRDYVLVGDLLNYELKPVMEEWKQAFEQISQKLTSN